MANSIGRLVVELAASTAKFQSDLGKAAREAEIASKRISTAFSFVKGAVAGAAGAFSIAAFANIVKGSIDAADHLHDLSQQTGVAVETLSGLGLAAQQSGTDLDSVAKGIGKLNIQIAAGAAGNEESLRTFKALGLSMADLGRLTPEEVFARVADKFEGWNDGANKAAIGNRLFGKSYQELIPLLNQGGDALRESAEYAKKYSGVTTEVSEKADKFNDSLAKLKLLTGGFGRTLAAELLDPLNAFAEALVKAEEKNQAFSRSAEAVATALKGIASVAVATANAFLAYGDAIGAYYAALGAVLSGEFKRAFKVVELATDDQKKRLDDVTALLKAINNPPAANIKPPKKGGGKTDPPSLGSTDAEDTAKRILDGQIRALERSIKDEEDQLRDRERFLSTYYQDGYLSTKDYYDRRQQVISDSLAKELDSYDKELAALRAFSAKATPKDRIDAENRIAEVIDKRAAAQKRASVASADLFLEEAKAAEQFRDKIEDIAVQLAELRGDTVSATLARFDKDHADLQRQVDLKRQSFDEEERRIAEIAQQKMDALRQEISLRSQLTEAQRNFSLILDQVGNAQARIDIARRSGSLTELEALHRTSEASRARIADLQKELEAAQRLADALQSPEALQAVDNLKLKIEELAATGDLVAKKFNDVFVNSFSDALTDFATGAKGFKDILKDLEKSIVGGISRIASQNIAETLFKPENLGGVGSFFSNLFGFGSKDKSKDVGGAALTSAGATLTTAGTTMTTAATTLLTASASLQAAAVAMGASGIGSNIASAFMPGGFSSPGVSSDVLSFFGFANGGSPPIGKASLVGERGPELFVPRQSGTVIPNEVLSAKRAARTVNQTVNINVSGNPNTKTLDQMAVEVGRATRRAMARNS